MLLVDGVVVVLAVDEVVVAVEAVFDVDVADDVLALFVGVLSLLHPWITAIGARQSATVMKTYRLRMGSS